MQQLLGVWQALDVRRKAIVAGATLAMFAAVLALSSIASKPSMALLYAGLDGASAGEVLTALDQQAVAYEVRGAAIYVPAAERDQLRMALAAEGLPATGGAGYELLDSLSGFGTTAQMFDAAYWRAKEGELARTISASRLVRSARVHIATPAGQPFRRDLHPTASISVQTTGGGLAAAQAKALKYLVASAVPGMTPEDVSVIDADSGVILAAEETTLSALAEGRAGELRRNVERLLEARVGYGKAVVEVTVDTVTEREAITERRFDPQGRVAISSEVEERSDSSNATRPGGVTVASNLPTGDAEGSGRSQSQTSETRERTNFEVSETTRELVRDPGAVRRLTVAVLVDGVVAPDATGAPAWQPRPEEELAALRELVASAVGFDAARGDVITLKSMPFQAAAEAGSAAAGGLLGGLDFDAMSLIRLAVLAVVALILGLFVLRPILAGRPVQRLDSPNMLPGPPAGAGAALTGEIDDGEFAPPNLAVVSDDARAPLGVAPGLVAFDSDGADPMARLRRLIAERQHETATILRGWIEQEEKAG